MTARNPGSGSSRRRRPTPDKPEIAIASIPGAVKKAMPRIVAPQLAIIAAFPPADIEWLHEIKFDGYRMLVRIIDGKARFISRNGNDWTRKFSTIAALLDRFPAELALLDGEVVHLEPNGVSSFSALQADLSEHRMDHVVYCAFDLLYLDGYLLIECRLEHRKRALEMLIAAMPDRPVRYSEHVCGNGPAFFAKACEHGLEGIVSKRRDAPYRPSRTGTWLKIKCMGREEFVVVGWTDPAGHRQGLGSLLLGYYDADGNLHYAGRVGTGFSDKMLRELRERLDALALDTPPSPEVAADAPRRAHWVRPELVTEIRFAEWTRDRRLRQPSFLGLREDKAGKDVILDPRSGTALKQGPASTPQSGART
jgi:bifunctional non-homologous end joining protein LigD